MSDESRFMTKVDLWPAHEDLIPSTVRTHDLHITIPGIKPGFHKAFFQWQMIQISDKSADNQSEARISVAYNKNCQFVTDDKFCETPPGLHHLMMNLPAAVLG